VRGDLGDAYGLTSDEAAELGRASGWGVIVLDKESRPPKRADGKLLFIESVATDPRFLPASGRTRYNVHMDNLAPVSYHAPFPRHKSKVCKDGSPSLNHFGIAILRLLASFSFSEAPVGVLGIPYRHPATGTHLAANGTVQVATDARSRATASQPTKARRESTLVRGLSTPRFRKAMSTYRLRSINSRQTITPRFAPGAELRSRKLLRHGS